ncbi:MAG TPA: hypothetical protein VK866_16745 [Acidimicrobiales bacterium]|nr:hypothetical protein [Acidimicrobiales bacterium]
MYGERVPRPLSILVVQVLVYVHAVVNLLGGLTWILGRNDLAVRAQTGLGSTELLAGGIVLVIAGLLYAWIAKDLGAGSPAAVWMLSFFALSHVIAALWLVLFGASSGRADLAFQGVLSGLVLVVLHTTAADRFFSQRTYL